jgi:hypothetical protein
MRLPPFLAVLVLLPTFAFAQIPPPREKKVEEPKELMEVKTTVVVRVNGEFKCFSGGRRFCISINSSLPNARVARGQLVKALTDQKQLDQVVLSRMGNDEAVRRLNISIGDQMPISMAQASIAAFATDSKLPIHLELLTANEGLGYRYRIFIGGYADRDNQPLTSKQIQELLKPGLSAEELHTLIAKFGN